MAGILAPAPDTGLTDSYNTKLSVPDETQFQVWAGLNPRLGNTYDYDARGFWKDGAVTATNGHGADKYKKPNHPTFSNQSMYHGVDGNEGGEWGKKKDGSWTFKPSDTVMKYHDPDDLKSYFQSREKGNALILPEAK